MSRMQEGAKPVVLKLSSGDWNDISPNQWLSVANYAVMSTMNLEFSDISTQVITQRQRSVFRENLTPPPRFEVMAGYFAGKSYNYGFWHNAKKLRVGDDDYYIQYTTFHVGKLFLSVISSGWSSGLDDEQPPSQFAGNGVGCCMIWPHGSQDIERPESLAYDEDCYAGVRLFKLGVSNALAQIADRSGK